MPKNLYLITPLAKNFPADPDSDYIGVDAGFLKIQEAGLKISMLMGDFDSLPADVHLPADALVFPVKKDETDSELAMKKAMELNRNDIYYQIILWGGLSGRLDHTLANVRLIVWKYPGIILQDEKQKVQCLLPGKYIFQPEYKHLSFFAMEESVITLKDVLYELEEYPINQKDVFTVSNSFLDNTDAKVIVHSGRVLCVQSSYV